MRAIHLIKKGKFDIPTLYHSRISSLTHVSSCSFFQWAEFDDDGEPPWAKDGGKATLDVGSDGHVNDRSSSPLAATSSCSKP